MILTSTRRLAATTLATFLLFAVGLTSAGGARTAARAGRSGAHASGIASESPSAILKATSTAVQSLQSVHVQGSGADAGKLVGFDLTLKAGVGSTGSLSLNGDSIKVVILGGEVYINGSQAFWKANTSAAVAQLVAGKWLKGPSTGSFASFAEFGSLSKLFQTLFASHGKLTKSAKTTVRGVSAIGLVDTTQGGTLYVAATGQPYPLEIVNRGKSSGGGTLSFTRFNAPVQITAPSGAINLSQLKSAGA